jgi:RimJ/RimL family protein N-acetyltransferase
VQRPFRPSDLPIYQNWFSDPETRRWISRPDERWQAHVLLSGRSACWVLEDSGDLSGLLQVDWDENRRAFVSVVVDPAKRGRGLGTRLLRWFLAHHSHRFEVLTASVAPDNRPSLALALRCGFEHIGEDDDGFVQLTKQKPA